MSLLLELTSSPFTPGTGEWTTPYKTYVKRAVTQGLQSVFQNHPDARLRYTPQSGTILGKGTKVTIEYPMTAAQYPTVVIRFYERQIQSMGVGHAEIATRDGGSTFRLYKHYNYTGDIEFAVYALTATDRDLIADTLVQTITMGDLNGWTNNFLQRIYWPNINVYPDALNNYININTDILRGFGETQMPAPWRNDNDRDLIYQVSYRSEVFGEFYNVPTGGLSYIKHINLFPYIAGIDPVPTGSSDPAPWYHIIGNTPVPED